MAPPRKKTASEGTVVFTAPEGVTAIGLAGEGYDVVDGQIEVPVEYAAEHLTDFVVSGFTPSKDAPKELYDRAAELVSFEDEQRAASAAAAAEAAGQVASEAPEQDQDESAQAGQE